VSFVRGRQLPTLLAAGLVALGAAGCGGGDELAPQAPGPPADVRVPESSEAPAGGSSDNGNAQQDGDQSGDADNTGTDEATPTPTATPDGGAETPAAPEDTGAAVPDEGGGSAAPEAQPDGPTNDTAPPAGSEPEQFEDFCAQNPGAC
jgi:hypothetical protein